MFPFVFFFSFFFLLSFYSFSRAVDRPRTTAC